MSVDDQQIPFAEDCCRRPTSRAAHVGRVPPRPPRAGSSPSPAATGTTCCATRTSPKDERIIVNMGPQHPSTHGVLRLILEIEGETVTQARSVIGYLHTGIEKSCEFRTWTQAVTFLTRADYLSPAFNEAVYCMAVEKLLGHRGAAPRPGHPGAADGADPDLVAPGRDRHRRHGTRCADRHDGRFPGARGSAAPDGVLHRPADEHGVHPARRGGPGPARRTTQERTQQFLDVMRERLPRVRQTADRPTDLEGAHRGRSGSCRSRAACSSASPARCCARAGLAWDLRKTEPYCGYEEYEFDVPVLTGADCYARFRSCASPRCTNRCKIMEQALDQAGRARSGDGRGREDRLAGAAVDRAGRHGQFAGARPQDHGPVDGVADPPLQAGHRGFRGPARPGVRRPSRARAASSAATWCRPAAPGRGGCTCAIPASSTCRRCRR